MTQTLPPQKEQLRALQARLQQTGRYGGIIDGQFGPLTGGAVMMAMTDGPDTKLVNADYEQAALTVNLQAAHVKAFAKVESAGEGFVEGRPIILFEPHRFSRSTQRRFDGSHPEVSYPTWDRKKYPASQAGRYAQLTRAVGLNVHAGFMSASYGKFQILGENFGLCGYADPFSFAEAQARDERTQLRAWLNFVVSKGIDDDLRAKRWDRAALKYNGTAYRENGYHTKLARYFTELGGV